MTRNVCKLFIIVFTLFAILSTTACQTVQTPKRTVPSAKNDIAAYNPKAYNYAYSNFKSRAEHGDPVAQNNLGKMYADGRGAPQDLAKSVEWFTKAAMQGEPDAALNLGVACLYGRGTTQDHNQACYWFKAAKRAGNRYANEFYTENC